MPGLGLMALSGEGVVPVIKAADLAPITETITTNAGVLIPVGCTIMAIMIGIAVIPRIIYKFF